MIGEIVFLVFSFLNGIALGLALHRRLHLKVKLEMLKRIRTYKKIMRIQKRVIVNSESIIKNQTVIVGLLSKQVDSAKKTLSAFMGN